MNRVAHPSVIRTFLSGHPDLWLPDVDVDHVTLYSSTLTERGPKYKCEQEVRLPNDKRIPEA
jgi:2'-5' RNA ligase